LQAFCGIIGRRVPNPNCLARDAFAIVGNDAARNASVIADESRLQALCRAEIEKYDAPADTGSSRSWGLSA